jgi:hypothetical protein
MASAPSARARSGEGIVAAGPREAFEQVGVGVDDEVGGVGRSLEHGVARLGAGLVDEGEPWDDNPLETLDVLQGLGREASPLGGRRRSRRLRAMLKKV